MKLQLSILIILTLLSCAEHNEIKTKREFEIEIIDKVPYCPLTIIEFKTDDLKELERITEHAGELRCHTYNLPDGYDQPGQKLIVTIRKTTTDEYFFCISLGPSFPYSWVTIVDVIN